MTAALSIVIDVDGVDPKLVDPDEIASEIMDVYEREIKVGNATITKIAVVYSEWTPTGE